ncbi:alpha/beta superfamily hydrolase (macronuclear) [Tetrahymena thermophila SB210]|uniref:Alpha/beta superfamily hydrolase n=1 Tax=Tetrahymena thermophila (strain SB210) TaxID=312017 RepID=I7M2C4_TETTS|nr:alpha/beta superfamily hydrolase [Tetrahymena thermophila SB210]EAR99838.1 alpha/beta superfamily hydrolase [Tetrahymena thermophila SB210]|eukprot:XP_001020083.1 alpha/beta superfamily hydrolase [Tetrahymena thermophila SB210]
MELNSIIFPQLKTKISLEAFLNGKLAYIPKLKKISEDSQIPMSPRSSRPSEMMARYPAQSVKATKNIAFEQRNDSLDKSESKTPSPRSSNSLRMQSHTVFNQVSSTSLNENKNNKFRGYAETSSNLAKYEKEQPSKKGAQLKVAHQYSTSSFTQISTEEVSQFTESSSQNTPKNNNSRLSVFAGKKCSCHEKSQRDIRNSSYSSNSRQSSVSSCICDQGGSAQKAKDQTNTTKSFMSSIFQFNLSSQKTTSNSESGTPNKLAQSVIIERNQQRNSIFNSVCSNNSSAYKNDEVVSMGSDKKKQNHSQQRKIQITESQLYNPDFMGYDVDIYQPVGYVPVLYLNSNTNSDNLLIYFHANGEDIFSSYPLLNHLRQTMEINIIGVEYPGYGTYKTNQSCTADLIQEDAQYVFDFVTQQLKFELKNIILLGRSIGTGPATYLASKHQVGALVLISAFTSIRGIVEDFAWFFKYIIKERFNNLENIKKVSSPTFFLHGKKDSLISYKQSQTLSQHCKSANQLDTPSDMNHGHFNYEDDLTIPLLNFLLKNNYPLGKKNLKRKPLPEGLTYHPNHIQTNNQV